MKSCNISVYKRIRKYLNYSKTLNRQQWLILPEAKDLNPQMQLTQALEIVYEF